MQGKYSRQRHCQWVDKAKRLEDVYECNMMMKFRGRHCLWVDKAKRLENVYECNMMMTVRGCRVSLLLKFNVWRWYMMTH